MSLHPLRYWAASCDDECILWVSPKSTDFLPLEISTLLVLQELDLLLQHWTLNADLKGIIFHAGDTDALMPAVETDYFSRLEYPDELLPILRLGQRLLDRIQHLSIPTIAWCEHPCQGLSFELVWACQHGIATPETTFAFPEAGLGLLPAWGSFSRKMEQLSLSTLWALWEEGKPQTAGALSMQTGLRYEFRQLMQHCLKAPQPSFMTKLRFAIRRLTGIRSVGFALWTFFKGKRVKTEKQRFFKKLYTESRAGEPVHEQETHHLLTLLKEESVKQKTRVFFLEKRLQALGLRQQYQPHSVACLSEDKSHIPITASLIEKGFKVYWIHEEAKTLSQWLVTLRTHWQEKGVEKTQITAYLRSVILDKKGDVLSQVAWVMDWISEDAQTKRERLMQLEQIVPHGAFLSVVNSIESLSEMSQGLKNPQRFFGLSLFSEGKRWGELTATTYTSATALEKGLSFLTQLDYHMIPTRVSEMPVAWQLWARCFSKILEQLDEGVEIEQLETVFSQFGFQVSPCLRADTLGLDTTLQLLKRLGEPVPEWFQLKVLEGHTGLKVGKGFYRHQGQKHKLMKQKQEAETIPCPVHLLLTQWAAFCEDCVVKQSVSDRDLMDLFSLFVLGFPEEEGGLLNYIARVSV